MSPCRVAPPLAGAGFFLRASALFLSGLLQGTYTKTTGSADGRPSAGVGGAGNSASTFVSSPPCRHSTFRGSSIKSTGLATGRAPAEMVSGETIGPSSGSFAGSAALLVCAALASRHRVKQHSRDKRHRVASAAVVETKDALESDVAALERQAALLRESAAVLEAEQAELHRAEQRSLFKAFDTDLSGGIDVQELQTGWRNFTGTELDQDVASRLVEAHDENRNGTLEFEEFDIEAFRVTLKRLWAEDQDKELAAREEEETRQKKLEAEEQLKEYYERLPGNDDAGLVTRLFSALAYLLPLVDCSSYAVPLGILFPPLMPLIDFFLIPYTRMEHIPFAQLGIFLVMRFIADRTELPALLRFNLYQAIQLDIALLIPLLLTQLSNYEDKDRFVYVSLLAVLAITASVAYSIVSSLCGIAPRGIPFISGSAEEGMGLKKPEVVPDDSKDVTA